MSHNNYIEETRDPSAFKENCKLDKPTGVGDHSVPMDNLKVLDREQDWMKRKVQEAIHIKQRAPSMNRAQGYQLSPIYGQIITRPPSKPNRLHDHCLTKICWGQVETSQSFHTNFQSE